jgi:GDP-L-fucose synthase
MTIVVAGHTGLVGSAIFEALKNTGEKAIGIDSNLVDLTDRELTFNFIQDVKPTVIIDAAAVVGGIGANDSLPVDFLSKNLQIQTNLMDAAHVANVEKFLFLGSSCIYPRDSLQPIKEEYLLTGPLERTNSAYAIAKIAGIELIKSYRRQHGKSWISLMPTNVYGPRDNFNINHGHVLASLINKFVAAVESDNSSVSLWGSGNSRREFLYSKDLAVAVMLAVATYDSDLHLNVGSGEEVSIRELAELIAKKVGFRGEIKWDSSKPDGTPRKLLDSERIRRLGFTPKYSLSEGIEETINWFVKHRGRGVLRV